MSRPGDEQPAREAREEHETTVNDRWVGALLESWRVDTPGALDARVGRAMTQLRREARAAAGAGASAGASAGAGAQGAAAADERTPRLRLAGGRERSLGARTLASLRDPRAWWRAPLAAAASIAAVMTLALVLEPRPAAASATALVRAAQASESRAGDRSYSLRLLPPGAPVDADSKSGSAGGTGRPDAASSRPPTVRGRLDIRDATHMRLEMELPDGKRVVRVLNGDSAWEQRPDGGIYRVPVDRAMPRWIETDGGSVMVERLENLLAEIGDDYAVQRSSAAPADAAVAEGLASGLLRVTATRRGTDERGPATIDLWLDPASSSVQRAVLAWNRPAREEARGGGREDGRPGLREEMRAGGRDELRPGPRDEGRGGPPFGGGEQRRGMRGGPEGVPDGGRMRGGPEAGADGGRPRAGRGGDLGPPRPPLPGTIIIDRVATEPFADDHFAPPQTPRDPGPGAGPGQRGGPEGAGGPDGLRPRDGHPPRGDRGPGDRGPADRPPPR